MAANGRFWRVQAVFGCEDHPGPGFAYTMGLATRGLHELYMWDRPTHGDDPGADFSLSSDDLGHTLNDFAQEWVAGSLRVGDVRELALDDGLTKAVITFGEPVEADSVDAYGARPSLVVPLRWSLHRPPRGDRVPILPDAQDAYERDVRATDLACDLRVTVSGLNPAADVLDFDVDGAFGPLSALVSVHAAAMAGVSRPGVLLGNALDADAVATPGALIGHMSTLSRLSGRDEQMENVHQLTHRVVDRLVKRRAWRNAAAEAAGGFGMSSTRSSQQMADRAGAWMLAALMGLALDDVLPDELALAAQGPWRATLSATGTDPGRRWRCSPVAEQAIRQLFASFDPADLRHLASSMTGPIAEVLGEDLLRVRGTALTSAVAPPEVDQLVPVQHSDRLTPLVIRQLSSFAQLMACVIDGVFPLDQARSEQIADILEWGMDVEWWNVA